MPVRRLSNRNGLPGKELRRHSRHVKETLEEGKVNIDRDGFHGEWNYTISPTPAAPAGATGAATNLGAV